MTCPIATLIDVNCDDVEKTNRIYTDYLSHEFGITPVRQLLWGTYEQKPLLQQSWDMQVQTASEIAAASQDIADSRPRIKDLNSGKLILIDTGASVSVWPKSDFPEAVIDNAVGLKALNGNQMPTYGTRQIKMRFNKKVFVHTMTLSTVKSPILGWDWLSEHQLDILCVNGKCVLFHKPSKAQYTLSLGRVATNTLSLSTVEIDSASVAGHVSFKKYSAAQKSPPEPTPIPTAYQKILDKYHGVLECRFDQNPKHGIVHEIITSDRDPCKAKMRPLLAGSRKAELGYKRWMELDKLGVIKKMHPNEQITWSSALHFVPKDGNDLRVCSDFRPLNDRTALDHYPLPSIRAFAHKLEGQNFSANSTSRKRTLTSP